MQPALYNFYVGTRITGFTVNANMGINTVTGEYTMAANTYASDKIAVPDDCTHIYFHMDPRRIHGLYLYTSGNDFIGFVNLYLWYQDGNESLAYKLPDNIGYIAYTMLDTTVDIVGTISPINFVRVANPYYKDLNKKLEKESSQEFFRVTLDGKINLRGDDFRLVYNADIEDELIFAIEKYNTRTDKWIEYYKGNFTKTDCKFNVATGNCELKVTTIDNYTELLNKYENTYDLIKLAPALSEIKITKRALIQIYIGGSTIISNFIGGTYWEAEATEAIADYNTLRNTYYFAPIRSANELHIRSSNDPEVNGMYAGIDGKLIGESGKYYISVEELSAFGTARLTLRKVSDDTEIGRSTEAVRIGYFNDSVPGDDASKKKFFVFADADNIAITGSNFYAVVENMLPYRLWGRLLLDVDSITDSTGTHNTYAIPYDDISGDHYAYKKCIGLSGSLDIYCKAVYSEEPTKFGMNDYKQYFTDNFLNSLFFQARPLPISRNDWINSSLWFTYDSAYENFEKSLRVKYTLKDSYSIADAIKALLKEIAPKIKHEATSEYSEFLYGNTVPLPGFDRFFVYITQKTNILKGKYDQAAQKAEITLKDIFDMLAQCFKCFWYIDSENRLRIEHISYFINGMSYAGPPSVQVDMTQMQDQFNKKNTLYFQTEIEYDKSKLNSRYEFAWMDDCTEPFDGLTLDINSSYVQKDNKEEITVSNFSPDVDYMLFAPGEFSNDGFALLCPVKASDGSLELPIIKHELIDENNNEYEATTQNYYASWPFLIKLYMYDLPAKKISCNMLKNLNPVGTKKTMQNTIDMPVEEDLDENRLIKTVFGNGQINSISTNINTRIAKVELVYRPI